jgi:hypothetical protein
MNIKQTSNQNFPKNEKPQILTNKGSHGEIPNDRYTKKMHRANPAFIKVSRKSLHLLHKTISCFAFLIN